MSQIINQKTVEEIAGLARLGLTDQEVAEQVKSLNDALGNFASIQQVDTAHTPTSDDVTGLKNIVRPDHAAPSALCSMDELLAMAPATKQRQLKVPSVF